MPRNHALSDKPLQLWLSRLSDNSLAAEAQVQHWLSSSEQQRLAAMGHKRRRREYLLSRYLIRHALSQRFGGSEAGWRFDDRPGQAPRPLNSPVEVSLSLSHSSDYMCLAIDNHPLGVDI